MPITSLQIELSRYNVLMEKIINAFKALSNPIRLDILYWLKNPTEEFSKTLSHKTIDFMMNEKGGICVGDIVQKSGLAQSTMSKYLKDLESAGFLLSERHGKWTYYRRNEKNIQLLADFIKKEL